MLELVLPVAHDVLGQHQHAPLVGKVVGIGVQQGDGLDGFAQACTCGTTVLDRINEQKTPKGLILLDPC